MIIPRSSKSIQLFCVVWLKKQHYRTSLDHRFRETQVEPEKVFCVYYFQNIIYFVMKCLTVLKSKLLTLSKSKATLFGKNSYLSHSVNIISMTMSSLCNQLCPVMIHLMLRCMKNSSTFRVTFPFTIQPSFNLWVEMENSGEETLDKERERKEICKISPVMVWAMM